jgi:hypothetical protein
MSYITPRVKIQQEFEQLPVYSEFPLPAFILGPNYALQRYTNAAEKPFSAVTTLDGEAVLTGSSYLPDADTRYDYPNLPLTGGAVDSAYTKVFFESTTAQYFPHVSFDLTGGDDEVSLVETPHGGIYQNRVRFDQVVLKTANGYTRSAAFSNRDVAVGDVITLTDTNSNTVTAKVKALHADTSIENMELASSVGSTVASASSGAASVGTSVFSDSSVDFAALDASVGLIGRYLTATHIKDSPGVFKIIALGDTIDKLVVDYTFTRNESGRTWHIGGTYNGEQNTPWECEDHIGSLGYTGTHGSNATVTVSNTSTSYVGYNKAGVLADTYTVTVTTGGLAADAQFSITTLHGGLPDQYNMELVANVLTVDNAGDNDLKLNFTRAGGDPATVFVIGDAWSFSVTALVEPLNLSTAGNYTGSVDMTYKVVVDRGGDFYDGTNAATCARLHISASDIDVSSIVLPRLDTSFNVGNFGVTASFESAVNNGGLIVGDSYYVEVKAAKFGPTTIVELAENLPTPMLLIPGTINATLSLTQKAIQVPSSFGDFVNWSQEGLYITVNGGITTYDNGLVYAGSPVRLTITAAQVFVEYRILLHDHVVAIDSVRDLASVKAKLGTIHPDNPLAQAVNDAVLNAANQIVYFIGVQTDDLAGYTEAIQISEKSDKVYSFVPLTFDRTIQDAVVSHVNAYSTPEVGRWRIAWLSVEDKKTAYMYNLKEDATSYTATVTDDPAVLGTQNKLLTMAGAKFIEDEIRPTDTVRLNFRTNADGVVVYDEYVVAGVRTNTTLLLSKNLATPITSPVKAQIVRNYTKSERATNISLIGGEFNNRRVRCVFPDSYKYGGITKQGYIAAAGLAGLRSGVVPHQGLTNSEFLGADDLSKIVIEFTQDDLDVMAEQGIWLITQAVIGATPYVRHQLTTDTRALNTSEDSITTNVDNISYALKHALSPFIGRYNVNPENIAAVREAIVGELIYRATSTRTVRAGNQLVSFTPKDDIISIGQTVNHKDSLDIEVRLNVPYPMNYINLKLVVG